VGRETSEAANGFEWGPDARTWTTHQTVRRGARLTQPGWALARPSSHEEGLLHHCGGGSRRIDLDWLQRRARSSPNCDRPPGPGWRSRTRIAGPVAGNGSRPERGGRAIRYHNRQQWQVPVVIAAWHLPADRAHPRSDGRWPAGIVLRSADDPRDHAHPTAQHLDHLLGPVTRRRVDMHMISVPSPSGLHTVQLQ
jgi:hypothetical protein